MGSKAVLRAEQLSGGMNWKWMFNAISIVSALATLLFAWRGDNVAAPFFLALAFGIFGSVDKFTKFKASLTGIEAETRATLKETKDALEEVRELASLTAKSLLTLVKGSGRMGGYDDDEEEAVLRETMAILDGLGVAPTRKVEALEDWHRFVEHDYRVFITGGSQIPRDLPREMISTWKELREGGIKSIATPEEIEKFYASAGILTKQRTELLDDYRHYLKTRTHRRPEMWRTRRKWFD